MATAPSAAISGRIDQRPRRRMRDRPPSERPERELVGARWPLEHEQLVATNGSADARWAAP